MATIPIASLIPTSSDEDNRTDSGMTLPISGLGKFKYDLPTLYKFT